MTKVKICGLKTADDALKVNEFTPEYVGFVFAEGSKRRVNIETAQKIKEKLKPEIKTVGVFVNQSPDEISELVQKNIIDVVQLHGSEDDLFIDRLKYALNVPIIKSVSIGNSQPEEVPQNADYILFDTASPEHGGTGKTFDWKMISHIKNPFFLAGGLNLENVDKAIRNVNPYCVDVSSGVETDGIKDREKIRRFVEEVRKL